MWEQIEELQLRLEEGRGKGKNVRALVIINPGNPAGNVLSHENMQEVGIFVFLYAYHMC